MPSPFSNHPLNTVSRVSPGCSNTKWTPGNLCLYTGQPFLHYRLLLSLLPSLSSQTGSTSWCCPAVPPPQLPLPISTSCTCLFGPSLSLFLPTPTVVQEPRAFLMGSLLYSVVLAILYVWHPFHHPMITSCINNLLMCQFHIAFWIHSIKRIFYLPWIPRL